MTAKSAKWPSKYRGTFCSSIGDTGAQFSSVPVSGTSGVRKWGKTKEKGGAAYEASTYFMARDVSKKISVPNTTAARTLGGGTVTVV